jgi:leishmanolysin-like peptidase
MNPYIGSASQYITAALLAVFEDSGWYQIDYTKADGMIQGRDWGFKQGCSFAKDKCLTSGISTGSPAHFFSSTHGRRCTLSRSALGYSQISTYSVDLPTQYQYFSSPTNGGGSNMYDYCPVAIAYSDGACSVTANAPAMKAWGEIYGATSLCIDSTLLWTRYS